MIGFILGGLALFGLGVVLIFVRRRAQSHLLEIRFLKHTPIAELLSLQKEIAGEIGDGGFAQLAETTGTVACDQPLTAELSGTPCAHYKFQIEERYEESYVERDSNGRETMRTRTGSTTVASNTQTARFFVADAGNRLRIEPDGARMDLQQSVDRFEPAAGGLSALQFGSFSVDLAPVAHAGRRVLGYHYAEWILPIDARVYVVGNVSDRGGEMAVRRPEEKDKPFIVSLKSEEEITRGMASKATFLLVGAIVAMAGGVGLIIAGLLRKH